MSQEALPKHTTKKIHGIKSKKLNKHQVLISHLKKVGDGEDYCED